MTLHNISATVIFVHDLDRCMAFYRDMLGFPVTFSDPSSHGFRLDGQDFVLLKVAAAAEMVGEAAMGLYNGVGHNILLCAGVDDVDATYQALTAKGLTFIRPPDDKPWGRRTAYFADPEGNLWELWHPLDSGDNPPSA